MTSSGSPLLSSHSQRVRHAVDVVEPRGDQRDLENRSVVETGGAQTFVIVLPDFGRVLGDFHHVVEHDSLLRSNGSGGVVLLQRIDQFFIQRDATQKLCVGVDSINAPVGD